MASGRILVVDNDRKAVEMVRIYLERDGYKVVAAHDGLTALELARRSHPSLIVLDLMLPELSGLDVCRLIREESAVPIIMLTARTEEGDKLVGLDSGADDYVCKPFSPRELVARVRAVLRRRNEESTRNDGDIHVGPLTVSSRRHEVTVDGRLVALTSSEFRLLMALAREPNRAFTRPQLVQAAFGDDFEGVERNVDVHIMKLRRKLSFGADGPIKAVFGVGYKYETT